LRKLPAPVVERTMNNTGGSQYYAHLDPAGRHFAALKRVLDRQEPDYEE
jgi:hypothetical protein